MGIGHYWALDIGYWVSLAVSTHPNEMQNAEIPNTQYPIPIVNTPISNTQYPFNS